MSLDFMFDAMELMDKGDHPYVIICCPRGTESAHIIVGDAIDDEDTVSSVIDGMNIAYDVITGEAEYEEHEEDSEED